MCVCESEGPRLEECHSAGTDFVRTLKRAEWALTQLHDSLSVLHLHALGTSSGLFQLSLKWRKEKFGPAPLDDSPG